MRLGSNMASRPPQNLPKTTQTPPKTPPELAQDLPDASQDLPRPPQNPPRDSPRDLPRLIFNDFGIQLGGFRISATTQAAISSDVHRFGDPTWWMLGPSQSVCCHCLPFLYANTNNIRGRRWTCKPKVQRPIRSAGAPKGIEYIYIYIYICIYISRGYIYMKNEM